MKKILRSLAPDALSRFRKECAREIDYLDSTFRRSAAGSGGTGYEDPDRPPEEYG